MPPEATSTGASATEVDEPSGREARKARRVDTANSSGVLTLAEEVRASRNSPLLRITRSTSRICPLGPPLGGFSQASMQAWTRASSGEVSASVKS